MTRRKIGLVGYFGYGNYGDELFVDVYKKFFYDCEVSVLQDSLKTPIYSDKAYAKIESLDAIIIGGGDLLLPKYFASSYFDDKFLEKPVYLHGVGVPLWTGEDPAVVERIAKFVQHPNIKRINARDRESARWIIDKLKPTAPVEYSVDMVFSLDFPVAPRDPKKKVFGLITRKLTPGQTRWDNITALCERARTFGYEIRNIVLGTGMIRDDDLTGLKEWDYSHAKLVDPNDIHQLTKEIGACDVIASTKFHGCVVAMAYGVPAITLTTTDKFLNLYRLIEREDLISHFIHEDLTARLPKYVAPIPRTTRVAMRNDATAAILRLRRAILNEVD
ncbi:polysaccharide pyruvyl transferase family protein [Terrarubrum flagellatum]|uniref:polysaccharide pyruvyl transferase family protein n=1 Tax=Terrirubrum flagellatum TaxID=2895980 RepID=UPI003144DC04